PEGWTVERVLEEGESADAQGLAYNETVTATYLVTVAEDAPTYNPYRRNVSPIGANGIVYGVVNFSSGGQDMSIDVDDDSIVAVLPDVSIPTTPTDLVYNLLSPDAPITLAVALSNYAGAGSTTVSLDLPTGWSSDPASADVSFEEAGDSRSVTFTLNPPADAVQGSYDIAVVADGELSSTESVDVIEYDHIGR